MRHLSVPSAQTQHWLQRCRLEKWLAEHIGVSSLDDGNKAIPLNDTAPPDGDESWRGNAIVELEPRGKTPTHWSEHLDPETYNAHKEELPNAYETQGDVLIVKIEDSVWHLAETIADAMLTQLPNIRLVCADLGVQGDFRVRELHPLATRDGTTGTRTRIKENGYLLWVDASKVYFSARLSNERIGTLESAMELREHLGRELIVADPYAGVGPSMAALLSQPELVKGYRAGDLNPDAVELLNDNLAYLEGRRKNIDGTPCQPLSPAETVCQDATLWSSNPELRETFDLLLVNLPHDSISHLPAVLPLLRRDGMTLLRGWAIIERENQENNKNNIIKAIVSDDRTIESFTFNEVKGFSAKKSFMCFEAWMAQER